MCAQPPFDPPPLSAVEKLVVTAVICASLTVIAWLAVTRDFFTFGTETDFLGNYLLEAQRVLTGAPLELTYHPPLYPMVLAQVWRWLHDWFRAGLLVSWLSAGVSLVSVFWVFLRLYGRAAAWGSLVGLVTSRHFLSYAGLATTDVFFLACVYGAILVSLLAAHATSHRLWCAAGLALGLLLLTRANAVSFLTLLAFPLVQARPWRHRLGSLGWMGLGSLLPLALWGAYAVSTGSPVWPTRGVADNIAMTYFAEAPAGRLDLALAQVEGRFASVLEVLAYQPHVLVSRYLQDLRHVAVRVVQSPWLVAFPVNLLAFAGLLLLLVTRPTVPALVVLGSILGQVVLINLKTPQPRMYLFLVPLLGAAAGATAMAVYERIPRRPGRVVAGVLAAGCLVSAAVPAVRSAQASLHAQDAELAAAVAAIRQVQTPDTLIVARRSRHLAYYTGSQRLPFPAHDVSLEGLRDTLERARETHQVLLYFGSMERNTRPHLTGLASPATAPAWLEPLAHGRDAGGWVLYRVRREDQKISQVQHR